MARKGVLIRIFNKVENFLSTPANIEEIERSIKEELNEGEDGVISTPYQSDVFMGLSSDGDGDFPVMFESHGMLIKINNELSLNYTSELGAAFPVKVEYRFSEDNRDALAVVKSSLFEEIYFFDNRCKRQTVVYEGNADFELSLYTKTLKNSITYENGGCLEIEYYAEIRGGAVEHCKEYVIVEPIND